jgi:hypothetical protein
MYKYIRIKKVEEGFRKPIYLDVNQVKKLSENQIEEYKKELFVWFREDFGFPMRRYTRLQKYKTFIKMRDKTMNRMILERKIVQNNPLGTSVVSSYFPHRYDVRPQLKKNSPIENFKNDKYLREAIERCFKMQGCLHEGTMFNILSVMNHTRLVSNWNPMQVKLLLQKFCKDGGVYYDPSIGWAGRLAGALSSNIVSHYIGTDPWDLQIEGATKFWDEYNSFKNLNKQKMSKQLIQDGSENVLKHNPKMCDIVFTSPPYFNLELYGNGDEDLTQARNKYTELESWVNFYLKKTISNCLEMLNPNGYIIINISESPDSKKSVVKEFTDLMETFPVVLRDVFKMRLQSMPNTPNKRANVIRTEPIFIYQRSGDRNWALEKKIWRNIL